MSLEQQEWVVEELLAPAQETNEHETVFRAREAKQKTQIKGRLKFGQKKIKEIGLAEQAENMKVIKSIMEVQEGALKQGLRLVDEKMHHVHKVQHRIKVKPEKQRCLLEEQHGVIAAEEKRQEGVVVQQQFLIDLLTSLSKGDIQLPQAIEKVIALKNERSHLLGIDVDAAHLIDDKGPPQKSDSVSLVDIDDATIETLKNKQYTNKHGEKKNQSLKFKAKTAIAETHDLIDDIDVEYIQVIDVSDPLYLQYMKIFLSADDEKEKKEMPVERDFGIDQIKEENINPLALRTKPGHIYDHGKYDNSLEEEMPNLSIKKFKKLNRMEAAKLKQNISRPEALEVHDIASKDPVLLLHLKATPNVLHAPCHRCSKRKYFQRKSKIYKPAFQFPGVSKQTGIPEMQQAVQTKDQKTRKTKMCESTRPKLNEIVIDYQKVCDDIFQWHFNDKIKMIHVTPLEETPPICSNELVM